MNANPESVLVENIDTIIRAPSKSETNNPALLSMDRVIDMSIANCRDIVDTPHLGFQIDEINKMGFNTKSIDQYEIIPGEIETTYYNYREDFVTYSGKNIVSIYLKSMYDVDNIEIDDYGEVIIVRSINPLNFTFEQIGIIDSFGGASMKRGIITIGSGDNKPFGKKEAIKIDKDIIKYKNIAL